MLAPLLTYLYPPGEENQLHISSFVLSLSFQIPRCRQW
jgi:hypothetical protein